MPTTLLVYVFHPRQLIDLKDKQHIRSWFDMLAAKQYYIWSNFENISSDAWKEHFQYQTISPDISKEAQKNLTNFLADPQSVEFSCRVAYLREELEFGIDISLTLNLIFLTINSGYFSFLPSAEQKYQLWLDVIETTYEAWHPLYGFFTEPDADFLSLTRNDVLAKCLPGLYGINVFGPEIVQEIGRKRLLQTSAWYKHEMPDGGIIFALVPFVDPQKQFTGIPEEVAHYLNLPLK